MAIAKSDPLDRVFMALADSNRRNIVHLLATSGETRVSDLASHFDMSLNAVSKHIKVLESARLIHRRIEGRVHYLSLSPEQMAEALDWISIYRHFWQQRLDLLEQAVSDEED